MSAALPNCFHAPMVTPSARDDEIVWRMNTLRTESNTLHLYINDENLARNSIWTMTTTQHLNQTRPILSLTDLRTLTLGNKQYIHLRFYFSSLGVYQLKRARSYAGEHADTIKFD